MRLRGALLLALLGCGPRPPPPLPATAEGGAPSLDAGPADVELENADGGAPGDAGAVVDAGSAVRWPMPTWERGSPETHGLDSADLARADAVAAAEGSYCLLVIRHGVLVHETYFNGATAEETHPSWSIAKSWTSAVVGHAIASGAIAGLSQRVADFIPEWRSGPRADITVGDLLRMTSGLQWSAFRDYVTMVTFTEDQSAFAVGTPLDVTPGSKWVYDNGSVQVLERVVRVATGLTLEQYASRHLWTPLGMNATWGRDRAGNPTAYANVLATCRDQARLGYLYLHHGEWAGTQVLPAWWIDASLTPSQPHNAAYGLLWWINSGAPAIDAMMQPWSGRMVPYAPPDLFAARGFGNQFVDVIPSLDLLVVRFGADPAGAHFDLGELMTDARFEKHDRILQPVLGAVRP